MVFRGPVTLPLARPRPWQTAYGFLSMSGFASLQLAEDSHIELFTPRPPRRESAALPRESGHTDPYPWKASRPKQRHWLLLFPLGMTLRTRQTSPVIMSVAGDELRPWESDFKLSEPAEDMMPTLPPPDADHERTDCSTLAPPFPTPNLSRAYAIPYQ